MNLDCARAQERDRRARMFNGETPKGFVYLSNVVMSWIKEFALKDGIRPRVFSEFQSLSR